MPKVLFLARQAPHLLVLAVCLGQCFPNFKVPKSKPVWEKFLYLVLFSYFPFSKFVLRGADLALCRFLRSHYLLQSAQSRIGILSFEVIFTGPPVLHRLDSLLSLLPSPPTSLPRYPSSFLPTSPAERLYQEMVLWHDFAVNQRFADPLTNFHPDLESYSPIVSPLS